MLNRLRASPVVRSALLAVALACCGLGLASDWPQVHAALARLHWYSVTGAFVAAAAGTGCITLAWRAILADLGSQLPVPAAVRVVSIAQVAKYLPGAVWAFAAQVELGRDYRVPRRQNAAAVVISLAVALGTGLAIGTATVPLASASAARHYWWIMALAPVMAVLLLPPVLRRLLDRAFALARRQPLERPMSTRGLLIAVGWTTAGWLLWGLQAWLLVNDLTGRGASVLPLACGAYALAWSAGILLVVFPGGIGPRELALVVTLAPVMPRGSALLVALVSRVVMTVSDVSWATAGVAIGRIKNHGSVLATPSLGPHVGKHRKTSSSRGPAPLAATVTPVLYAGLEADSPLT